MTTPSLKNCSPTVEDRPNPGIRAHCLRSFHSLAADLFRWPRAGRGLHSKLDGLLTGKWEGDTLVVDTKGFNGRTWLDQAGKPTTDALHVIERFRRKDFGHMDIEITIDDPKAYAKPWTVTEHAQLLPDTELMEFICNENNVDLQHLKGK